MPNPVSFNARKRARQRASRELFGDLEPRRMLSAALSTTVATPDSYILPTQYLRSVEERGSHPTAIPLDYTPAATSPPSGSLTPSQIRRAYGIDQVMFGDIVGDGTGQTIAIVDAYHYPTAMFDLQQFNAAFGLPDLEAWSSVGNTGPYLRVVSQRGGTDYPQTDPAGAGSPNGTWAMEAALDIQWAHAIAPRANIILVEGDDNTNGNLVSIAIGWARQQPEVTAVSMSFGQSEFFGQTSLDPIFTTPAGHTGITYFAATGDFGQPSGYPAFSPNVVAVGGTTLNMSGLNYLSESGWSGSGGSLSNYEPQPSYQNGVVTQSSTARANPDVAMNSDPGTGVPIYDSWDFPGSPWQQFGGTSLATPMWAGIMSIINQGRVLNGLTSMDGRTETLPKLYSLPASDFHDITTGNNGFTAGPGYDLVTGRGTPLVNLIAAHMVVPPSGAPGAIDLLAASDTGVSNGDNLTALDNSSPARALSFSVSSTIDGATVSLYADGTLIGTALATGTVTTITTTGAFTLSYGGHSITATQTQPGLGPSAASPVLVLTVDAAAPVVVAQSPAGTVAGAQTSVKLTFADAIDVATFDLSDINGFTGPAGEDLRGQITGFAWSAGNTVLDIQFNAQSAPGTYLVSVGPALLDAAGNAMAAIYSGSFSIVSAIYAASMDVNPGWSLGTSWAWGQPTGGGTHNGDPFGGHTGGNVIGYNLSGDYTRNTAARYAVTPAIDCTNFKDISLSFWRWLGVRSTATASVQASSDDGANWTTLWSNNSTTVSDNSWVSQQFSLPASFDGKAAVRFRWVMGPTGTSMSTYPGWNIDDVVVTGAPFIQPSVSGDVFLDANGNGTRDPGEGGMPGVEVFLDLNGNGVHDAGGNLTVHSTNVPVDIFDIGTSISTLNVSGAGGAITTMTITFDISHTYDADLDAYLIAPDGTQITLFTDVGDSGNNFTGTTLSDSAATSITSGSAPFSGTFRPSPGALSTFSGKSPNGTWTFKVVDVVEVDSGTINSWSLSFITPGEPATTTDATGHYQFNVAAGTYTVREVLPVSYVAINGTSHTVPVNLPVTGQDFAIFPTAIAAAADGASYYLQLDSSGTKLQISAATSPLATPTYQIAAALLQGLSFTLGQNQSLTLDFANGSPLPFNITLNSTHGNNAQVNVIGLTKSQTFAMTDYQIGLSGSGGMLAFNNLDILDLQNGLFNFSGTFTTLRHLIVDAGATLYWN